ncbi:hypothetical protein N7U66_01680 [Lacinutrix neustonica]|uniref:Uncharacterized protein n=1 Tax=Lacinutrix neustonica TaxID=2980107 RepID=A0A9E8MVM7_9FLAO|nr:hypothetical protein [Lacinutrix neustonica]WAC02452.1 hypothetical protein N7U66_01680 [Lacinutrix neustonica]
MKYFYLIFITLIVCSCHNDDDRFNDNVITLETQNESQESITSVLANGESLIVLRASISAEAEDNIQTIEFNKSAGDFLGIAGATASRPIDANGVATVTVRIPNRVDPLFFNAKVTAKSKTYIAESNIVTHRAYADNIIVEPSAVVITQASSVTLNTFLTRNEGVVSEGTSADFKAFRTILDQEVEVGRFTGLNNATTDQYGNMTVTFHTDTGDFDLSTPVFIKVSALDDLSNSITKTITIQVN